MNRPHFRYLLSFLIVCIPAIVKPSASSRNRTLTAALGGLVGGSAATYYGVTKSLELHYANLELEKAHIVRSKAELENDKEVFELKNRLKAHVFMYGLEAAHHTGYKDFHTEHTMTGRELRTHGACMLLRISEVEAREKTVIYEYQIKDIKNTSTSGKEQYRCTLANGKKIKCSLEDRHIDCNCIIGHRPGMPEVQPSFPIERSFFYTMRRQYQKEQAALEQQKES